MDKIDFNYAISQIKREIPIINNYQEIYLDSNKINTTFESIENSLNILYENTRHLENNIKYCESFLEERILEYSTDINNTLKSIEDIRDLNKNMAYIEYPCIFKDDLSVKKDRDNSTLQNTLIKDNSLTLGLDNDTNIEFKDIQKASDYIPYYDNLNDKLEKPYRSFYIEEKIASKGVTESITITLKEPTEINLIDIKPVNAEIENFRLVYVNGVEEYFNYNNIKGIFKNQIVAQIKFDLSCKKYSLTEYSLNPDKLTEDAWHKIKELEYTYLSSSSTKIEIESLVSRENNNDVTYYTNSFIASNLITKNMYNYIFGIDSITIKKVTQSKDSCFISTPIDIKGLRNNEFIELHISDNIDENSTIEYSIIDGNTEIPVIPFGLKTIRNEKVFSSLDLRFNQDESLVYIIKRNGITTDISLDDAKKQMLSRFSIDYFPSLTYSYKPINTSIKVKVTIRKYSDETSNTHINSIKIRKHGGETSWIEN